MKYFLIFCFLLISSPAYAQMVGYKGSDGYFHIRGLQKNKTYSVDLGGMPLIRAGISNSCGILRISSNKAFKESERFEITDEKAGNTYGFQNSNLPVKETARCDGTVIATREVWKDSYGTVYVSGLTPKSSQTIKLLTSSPTRNLRANLCGMISVRLDNPPPPALLIEGRAFPTDGPASRGIFCRRGTLYFAYPPPEEVSSVSSEQWKENNSTPSFSAGAIVATFSGGQISWNSPLGNPTPNPPPPSNPPGGSNPPDCTINPNAIGCPPPPEDPPPTTPTAPTTPTTPTIPTTPPSKPQPPAGQKMCKVGTQLVAIGVQPNKKHYAATPEDDVYTEADSDSTGYVVFSPVDYSDTWEGESAEIEVGEVNSSAPSWDNRRPLGSLYLKKLSVIQPCQNQ
jgi:hypothetical protein